MEDDSKELDLYFLDKHNERMNKELHGYKAKMNVKYKPSVFEVRTDSKTWYIYAHHENQAAQIAQQHLIKAKEIKPCDMDDLMHYNGQDMTFRSLTKGKKPQILGGF